jgi:hypothetical protein
MKMSEYLDNKRLKEWSHTEILQNESGRIYALNRCAQTNENELRKFDLAARKWETVRQLKTDVFPLNSIWDISPSLFAYPKDSNSVLVLRKENFTEVCKIPVTVRCYRLEISQSEQQIAILEPIGEIEVHKKGNSWYQMLGERTELKIFEIPSCRQINDCNKCILSEGLDWSPDSKKLLLVALRDSDVQKLQFQHVKKDYGYTAEDIYLNDVCPKLICLYDISTNSISELCQGTYPRWSPSGKEFIFQRYDKIFLYNVENHKEKFLCEAYHGGGFTWSASGLNLIGLTRTQNPMWTEKYFLTVINVKNPELKYVIDVGSNYYDFKWCQN